ncbi:MAG: biotin-dependent carboxyltransferase family protein [Pseudomonadales bacterium]
MSGFKVLQPGMLSLIQDAGRFGCHGIGLTTGGPIDSLAFRWANRLLGNALDATAVEVSIGGLELEATLNSRICVTGAELPLRINGEAVDLWQSHMVRAGDIIALGYVTSGARAYIAVAGGFNMAAQFGSTATVTRESLGGLDGKPLQQGDELACESVVDGECLRLPESYRPDYSGDVVVRVVPGYQQSYFSARQQARFFAGEYTVSDRCDRMGYRLEGPVIECEINGILSEGICYGAIQIPADGQPIVLLNDRQTIGGYPKIGSAFSLDAARLAQMSAGGKVQFEAIDPFSAHNELRLAESRFQRTHAEPC